jgi:hypothetical protein
MELQSIGNILFWQVKQNMIDWFVQLVCRKLVEDPT